MGGDEIPLPAHGGSLCYGIDCRIDYRANCSQPATAGTAPQRKQNRPDPFQHVIGGTIINCIYS